MFKFFQKIILTLFLLVIFSGLFIGVATAADLSTNVNAQLNAGAAASGMDVSSGLPLQLYIVRIVSIALSLFGIIFVTIIVWGGYDYLTAAGDDEKAKKGTKRIVAAIIGLAIVLAAFGITTFVGLRIQAAVNNRNFQMQNNPVSNIQAGTTDIRQVIDNAKSIGSDWADWGE